MLLIQLIFSWSLISSTIVALSASIPLYTWARLEVNTIAFIPIILDPNKPESVRAAIKYFFIQAYASLIFLVGPLLNSYFELTILISIIIKLGATPFHNWYPSVIANLNWISALTLSTWQKIAPLWILRENLFNLSIIPALAALNAIIGGIGGLIQTEIRPLLAFSSIGHIGWLLFSIPFSSSLIYLYFASYVLHLIIIILILFYIKIDTPKDIASSTFLTNRDKLILALILFSLGGLPPLLGFIPKLLILLVSAPFSIIPLFLIVGRYINIYYYITIIWTSFITNPQPLNSSMLSKPSLHIITLILFVLTLTLICGLNIHL